MCNRPCDFIPVIVEKTDVAQIVRSGTPGMNRKTTTDTWTRFFT